MAGQSTVHLGPHARINLRRAANRNVLRHSVTLELRAASLVRARRSPERILGRTWKAGDSCRVFDPRDSLDVGALERHALSEGLSGRRSNAGLLGHRATWASMT